MTALTPRECEILSLIIKEYSSYEIATQLELSIRTVETHRKNIYQKTQTTNMVGLVKHAIRLGIVEGYSCNVPAQTQRIRSRQYVG